MNGNKTLVAYLLSNGARISIDKFGNSPLHDCSIGGFIECARMLLANDCDPCQKDNQNMTASDIAELYGHTEFVQEVRRFERKRLESQSKDTSSTSSSSSSSNSSTKSSDNSNENKRSQLNNRSMRKTTSSHSIVNPIPASFIKPPTSTTDHEEQIKQMEEAISSVTSPIGCGGGSSYFHHHHHSTSSAVSTSTPSSNQDTKVHEPDKNTSTPPMLRKEDMNLVNNKENIVNINVQETRQHKSSNQVFIKIIRKDEFKSNNTQIVPDKKLNVNNDTNNNNNNNNSSNNNNNINNDVSAIEELDKCIAEFEVNTNLNKKNDDQDVVKSSSSDESLNEKILNNNRTSDSNNNEIIETKNSQENLNANNNKENRMNAINVLNQHFKKNPNMANNNGNMNYGNKSNQATTLPPSLPPPPPPPLPTNWLSLNEKSFLRSHQHK
jgi:hypothetical protein